MKKFCVVGLGCIGTILILAISLGASWLLTCGIIKLITLCFGWQFKWSIATGIWLVIGLISAIFKKKN